MNMKYMYKYCFSHPFSSVLTEVLTSEWQFSALKLYEQKNLYPSARP